MINDKTRDAWFAELAAEIDATRCCLLRVAASLGIDVSSGDWPACRLAMRIEQKVRAAERR